MLNLSLNIILLTACSWTSWVRISTSLTTATLALDRHTNVSNISIARLTHIRNNFEPHLYGLPQTSFVFLIWFCLFTFSIKRWYVRWWDKVFFFYITLLSITLSKILFKKSTTVVRIRSFVRSICLLALRNSSGFFFETFFSYCYLSLLEFWRHFSELSWPRLSFWRGILQSVHSLTYILFSLVGALRYAY